MTVVVDSSSIVGAFLPDEPYLEEARLLTDAQGVGHVRLIAPSLLPYECANAILKAVRQHRIEADLASQMLRQIPELDIDLVTVDPILTFAVAERFGRSAYDAAYLALAEQEGALLVTADERLYNAVRERLAWVVWLPEWRKQVKPDRSEGPQEEAHD